LEIRKWDWDFNVPCLTLDTIECEVPEAIIYNKGFAKHYWGTKFSHYCVKYEVGINVRTGLICWVAGPVPGAIPDATLFKRFLLPRLAPAEFILGDAGYRSTPQCLTTWPPLYVTPEEKQRLHLLTKARNKVQRVNRYLRHWNCLKTCWRHQLDRHVCVFHTCAQIGVTVTN